MPPLACGKQPVMWAWPAPLSPPSLGSAPAAHGLPNPKGGPPGPLDAARGRAPWGAPRRRGSAPARSPGSRPSALPAQGRAHCAPSRALGSQQPRRRLQTRAALRVGFLPWPTCRRCECGRPARPGPLLRVLTLPVGRAAGEGRRHSARPFELEGAGTAEIRREPSRSRQEQLGETRRLGRRGRPGVGVGGWPTGWDRKRGEKPPSAGSLCPPGRLCSPGRKGCLSLSYCRFTLHPEPLPPSPRGSRGHGI